MHEIDIHTHQVKSEVSIRILNIFAQDLPFLNDKSYYSAGFHPWHIGLVDPEKCLESIELATSQRNMLAVGECGLDLSVSIDFAMQEFYFRKQTEIAQKHSKPLIIHCVRAFSELMKIKKETKSDIPWIIHGFHGNQQTALQLMKHNFYFSIGKSLLSDQRKKDILKLLPADRLFLETDDGNTSISEIYSLAAQMLNISHEDFAATVLENFKRLFGSEKLPILI
ncbi:MAG: TatD family hydrolase [Bacteroidota bacterium]|nr:TatD family hydrolase [Bacteroidota bacterium]